MRVLLVEDEKALASIMKKGLEENGYSVDVAYDGEEGLFMAENYQADAVILDVMLPKLDGIAVLSKLRRKGIQTPVILLTAKDALTDKIKGLDAGADDYLTKPFEFTELLARVRSLVRRKSSVKEAVLRTADLVINTASHEVKRGGIMVKMSSREYAILEYMAYNKNKVLSRSDITAHVYDESFDKDSNIVDVYINYLRKKIDSGHSLKLIVTVRGAGYMLKDPDAADSGNP
ncbi:MAG: response regulator transcription factor, partial [Deltaproteobacteria bacterium]